MQTKHLKEISGIIAGYTFREALIGDSNGETKVLLAKNINTDGTINYPELTKISLNLPRTNAFVTRNDVLLSSRGIFRSGVFDNDSTNTIAASSMFILRIKDDAVMPEYLSIYLNSRAGQNSIQKILTGSTIKTILRRSLENLIIPIPSLFNQKMIVDISKNSQQIEKLLIKKIKLTKNIAGEAIKQLITN
ncbi:hypothetical protein C0416_04400 [bacterium]|nr:hypothetical protein [bacterium]